MKQYVMSIHTKTGDTVVTPKRFAISARCKRLKNELKSNSKSGFRRWGG